MFCECTVYLLGRNDQSWIQCLDLYNLRKPQKLHFLWAKILKQMSYTPNNGTLLWMPLWWVIIRQMVSKPIQESKHFKKIYMVRIQKQYDGEFPLWFLLNYTELRYLLSCHSRKNLTHSRIKLIWRNISMYTHAFTYRIIDC